MKISNIQFTPVSVPFSEPVPWRYGVALGVTSVMVRVETDSDVVGIGEAPGEPTVGVILQCLEALRGRLIGTDPRLVRTFLDSCSLVGADHFPYVFNTAVAAVEMALLDICGKSLGAPVHDLLGGRTNEAAEFYWHVNPRGEGPETVALAAKQGLLRGFRTMYLKGSGDVQRDLALSESVRGAVGPDVPLRIDPNEGWRPVDAWAHADRVRAQKFQFVEQPFPKDDLDHAVRYRTEAGVCIAANQSAWTLQDLARVLAARAADVVVTGIHQCGGIFRLVTAAQMCELAGIPLVRHSLCDLGVGTAAALQVLAAMPESGLAHQTHLTLLDDDLLAVPWGFEQGRLRVPTKPGLGVELDAVAVDRFAANYREVGEYRGYSPDAQTSPG